MTTYKRRAAYARADARNMFRSIIFAVVALKITGGAALADAKAITVEQLGNTIKERRSRIASMRGSYSSTITADATAKAAKKMIGVGQSATAEFAWSGQKRLVNETLDAVSDDMNIIHTVSSNVYDGTEFRRRAGKMFQIQTAKSSAADGNQYLRRCDKIT